MKHPTTRERRTIAPPRLLAASAALGVIAVVARALRPVGDELEPGVVHEGTLALGAEALTVFHVEVPKDGVVLDVVLACALADLDLFVTPAQGDDEDQLEREAASQQPFGIDRVRIDRFGWPRLSPGSWAVQVELAGDQPVVHEGRALREVPFRLQAQVIRARTDGELLAGAPQPGTLTHASGRFRTFRLDVPEGAPGFRLDVVRADGDVNLYARRGQRLLDLERAHALSTSPLGRESLVVPFGDAAAGRSGPWFVDVAAPDGVESASIEFEILYTVGIDPPPQLLEPPELSDRLERVRPELARASAAVVELFSANGAGSGTIVSASGYVLTAAHVVADLSEQPLAEVVVGMTLDPRHPSRESFRARVVEFDAELDAALLLIEGGRFGNALAPGTLFPHVALGQDETLSLGAPVWALGYPITGGRGSRSTLIATRGVVSGFESDSRGARWLKVDCEVNSGNSGGAVLDDDGGLVGVVTNVSEFGSGQLGFAVPLSALPAAWHERIEGR